ncbi:hypothetical protein BCT20_02245 [Vibrio sp. 10N.222.55.C12]|nr:hypothetical protein BCT20_02245 [Vibrio sp. 10N.222.55.C12]
MSLERRVTWNSDDSVKNDCSQAWLYNLFGKAKGNKKTSIARFFQAHTNLWRRHHQGIADIAADGAPF